MAYLIDTDIIIYSIKKSKTVQNNFRKYAYEPKFISIVTYGELLYGAKRSVNQEKNLAVIRRISELFPMIDISRSIMETFADLKVILEKTGIPIADLDLLIGASALSMNLILVTNNIRHFERVPGLHLENWASPANSEGRI